MPRRRTSEIITWSIVVAAGVSGVALFLDRDKPTTSEQAARAGMLLRVWRQDDVTRVTVMRGDEKTEIVRDGDGWKMTAPRVAPADFLAVTSLLNALGGARSERIVGAPSEADRKTFGLAPPRATVEVAMKGVTLKLALGASVTAQSDGGAPSDYLEVAPYGDDKGGVFVVAPDLARAIDRGADAYRDPSLLGDKVSSTFAQIALKTHDGGGVSLTHAEHGTWRVASGVPFAPVRADADAVDGLLGAFGALKADPFVADSTAVDASLGGTLDVTLIGGGAVSVVFGGVCPSKESNVLVQMRAPETTTGCVPRVVIDRLGWPVAQYVDGHLFGLKFGSESSKISEIEAVKIEREGKLVVDAERRGDGLHLRAPDDEQVPKEQTDRWLARLAALHGELVPPERQNIEKMGLAKAMHKVVLRRRVDPLTLGVADAGADEWEQTIEVGTPSDASDKSAYVRRLDDGAVVRIAAEDVAPLGATAVLELRAPNLVDVSYDRIVRIATTTSIAGAIPYEVERATATGMWQLVAPKELGMPDATATIERAKTIAALTCSRWAADRDDGSYGFSAPRAIVTVKRALAPGADAATPSDLELDFGAPAPDGVYVRAKGRDAVCVVPEGKLQAILRPPVDLHVLSFDPTDAPTIVVTKGSTKRAVRFDGKLWHDAGDAGAPMGDVAARALADLLVGLRAEAVMHLGAPTPDEGFSSPTLVVEAFDPTGKRTKRLAIGALGKLENTSIHYARVDDVDATYAVLREDVDKLLSSM